ncbi:MAG: glycoside hydrolase family 2 TIM barrel-domain containing protein [Terrimicrobiaceae bacterium]
MPQVPSFRFPRLSQIPVFRVLIPASLLLTTAFAAGSGSVVKIEKNAEGGFQLVRDGKPFFIKGAGGTQNLKELVKFGGNSIRTWGIESLEQKVDGKLLLDRAQELGLAVTAGIWIQHERHGFNYSDNAKVMKQRDDVRNAVRKYKDHPAILMWGLGNEMEGPMSDGSDPRIWKELNELARIVKEEDPNHPVMTSIASAAPTKVKGVMANYPNIDVLGVNAYGGASGVGRALQDVGWQKPFALTEFGPLGHWEVSKTSWGAPIEPSSRDKAGSYYATQTNVIADGKGECVGTYVFLWGQKQEVTSTWYGMFLKSGEKLSTVDATMRAWTGKWPENRCPKILRLESDLREAVVGKSQEAKAAVQAEDPESDPLTYEWAVFSESTDKSVGGDAEAVPPIVEGCIVSQTGGEAKIRTPSKPGPYRLFLTVRDGKGNASAENIPFLVK